MSEISSTNIIYFAFILHSTKSNLHYRDWEAIFRNVLLFHHKFLTFGELMSKRMWNKEKKKNSCIILMNCLSHVVWSDYYLIICEIKKYQKYWLVQNCIVNN